MEDDTDNSEIYENGIEDNFEENNKYYATKDVYTLFMIIYFSVLHFALIILFFNFFYCLQLSCSY